MSNNIDGYVLRTIRIANDKTITEVANMLQVSQPHYTKVEKNIKNLSEVKLNEFCNYFKINKSTIIKLSAEYNRGLLDYQSLLYGILSIYKSDKEFLSQLTTIEVDAILEIQRIKESIDKFYDNHSDIENYKKD